MIVLASNSPRRKEILRSAGINFTVNVPVCEEIKSKKFDEEIIKKNSYIKAKSAADGNNIIVAADTAVVSGSVCLVKPQNIFEAFFMLKKLSGKTHTVVTSHTVLDSACGRYSTEVSKSYVTFRNLSSFEIIKYILVKNPLDKAGSYGIQDFLTPENVNNPPETSFVSKLKGSYYNVVGLDIDLLNRMLENFQCV